MGPSDQPITTEIYADQAFFDSQNYVGTFSGNVIVNDPRFSLQAQKLTVQVAKARRRDSRK
jgi:lipopolysaccharide export system protein LptA